MSKHLPLIKKILNAYGVQPIRFYPVQKGYRNSSFHVKTLTNQHLNIIIFKNESDILRKIKASNFISDFLAKHNFPTRVTKGDILVLRSAKSVRYACIYTYLPGKTIPWEGYTMEHLKALGKSMSDMHRILKTMQLHSSNLQSKDNNIQHINECNVIERQIESMLVYFTQNKVQNALTAKLQLSTNISVFRSFLHTLTRLKNKADTCFLHMDFVRSNILFSKKKEITGILDFEKVSYGPRVLDIARTLSFLLVDCKYKPEGKIKKYFLYSGYSKRGNLGLPDMSLLPNLLCFFLFYDFYKFLKHNPYEFLYKNEHFKGTVRFLIEQKAISPIYLSK